MLKKSPEFRDQEGNTRSAQLLMTVTLIIVTVVILTVVIVTVLIVTQITSLFLNAH